MAARKTRRLVGGAILLVGAVLLIAALFSPWYTYQTSVSDPLGSGSTTINSYPGLPNQNGTVVCSSSGTAHCPYAQTSYQNARENNTGTVAEVGYMLLLIGFVLGFVGAVLGLASRSDDRRARSAVILGTIAVIVAILTPLLFWGTLPGAISKDLPAAERTTSSGPWSSFYGSSSSAPFAGISAKLTWGPSIGWYLSFVAFAIMLAGVVLVFRNRRDPPEPAPVSTPVPTDVASPAPAHQAPAAVPE